MVSGTFACALLCAEVSEGAVSAAETSCASRSQAAGGHGPKAQLSLKVIEEVHVADEADKMCKACAGQLSTWTEQFGKSEEVDVIER